MIACPTLTSGVLVYMQFCPDSYCNKFICNSEISFVPHDNEIPLWSFWAIAPMRMRLEGIVTLAFDHQNRISLSLTPSDNLCKITQKMDHLAGNWTFTIIGWTWGYCDLDLWPVATNHFITDFNGSLNKFEQIPLNNSSYMAFTRIGCMSDFDLWPLA